MGYSIDDLACPMCASALVAHDGGVRCDACAVAYPKTGMGQLDLRLQGTKRVQLDVDIAPQRRIDEFDRALVEANRRPGVAAGVELTDPRWTLGSRMPAGLLSHFPDPPRAGARLLDIGCGDAALQGLAERIGYDYTGVDYVDPKAPLWADSRALPFRDGIFDTAMLIGVLEHVEEPILAMREANRVLAPGGRVVGDVAFGEPYHDNSFFHHTILGTQSVVERAGFRLDYLAPHPTWHALKAYTYMVMLHGVPGVLTRAIYSPVWAAHRAWWAVAHRLRRDDKTSEFHRRHRTTGAFSFVATKL